MKKTFLTFFATIASLIVLAGNLLPVTAPKLVNRGNFEVSGTAVAAESKPEPAVPAQIPSIETPRAVRATVPAPVAVSAPSVVRIDNPIAVVESAPMKDTEVVAAVPETSAPAAVNGHLLVSEWLEVPISVLESLRVLPAPHREITEPSKTAPDQRVALNQGSPAGETEPAVPAAAEKPVDRSIPMYLMASLQVPSAIVERIRLLPVPLPPVFPETPAAPQGLHVAVNERERMSEAATPSELQAASRPAAIRLPELLTELAKTPSMTFERIRLLPVPLPPVFPETPAAPQGLHVAVNERERMTEAATPSELQAASGPAPIRLPELLTELAQTPSMTFERIRLLPLPLPPVFPERSTIAENATVAISEKGPGVEPAPGETYTAVAEHPVSADENVAAIDPATRAAAPNTAKPAVAEPEIAKPVAGTLPTFIATMAEVSSAIVNRVLLQVPAAPLAAEPASPAAEQTLAVSGSSPPAVPEPIAVEPEIAKPAARTLPTFIATMAEVSSAIVNRVLLRVPAAPVAAEPTAAVIDRPVAINQTSPVPVAEPVAINEPATPKTHIAAFENEPAAPSFKSTKAVAKLAEPAQLPVLVNGQTEFSLALLKPLVNDSLASSVWFSDSLNASSGGPSIESSLASEFGRRAAASDTAKGPTALLPTLITAQSGFSMDLLKPLNSKPLTRGSLDVSTTRNADLDADPSSVSVVPEGSYCDQNFVGPPIRFSQTAELKLEDLLSQLHNRFGVNFIIGPEIAKLPLDVKAGSIPWNILLRSQLYVSGVRATCVDSNTIELVLNSKVADLEKGRTDAERLESRYIKLKYLQPSSSGNKNIAGQSSGGSGSSGQGGLGSTQCQSMGQGGTGQAGGQQNSIPQRCKFERLMNEVRQILGLNDQQAGAQSEAVRTYAPTGEQTSVTFRQAEILKRPYVGQVPGRNMLMVNATASQLKDIEELIRHADVPPFQVVIKGLIYTANEDKLKDIGVQTTITNTGNGRTSGGIFGHTLGSLGTLFDFSTLVGTVDFNVQASALQRDGVISIKSRPFATVLDGDTTDLTVGRQIPVLIQAINPIGGAPGTLQILQAANLLSVTPHVMDDDKGNPMAVNLEIQLESNDVDSSILSQGVPTVSVRSIQSNFILNQEQTAILGGFTVDSDSKTITKTPGLGDIPILGELFKRRVRSTQINRLYFAISVTVVPYGTVIEPVSVPGATTDVPTLTPELLKRAEQAEPKQVPTPAAIPKKVTDHK